MWLQSDGLNRATSWRDFPAARPWRSSAMGTELATFLVDGSVPVIRAQEIDDIDAKLGT